MAFKINIGNKGKSWRFETDTEYLLGKKIGEVLPGKELKGELEGYDLEITGTSDKAGFPGYKDMDNTTLNKKLLTLGFGMRTSRPRGLRLRKRLRGAIISEDISQINMKITKIGKAELATIFPEQNKMPEPEVKAEEVKKEETKVEEKAVEEKKAE